MAGVVPTLDPRSARILAVFTVSVVTAATALLVWLIVGFALGTLDGYTWPARGLLLLMDYRPTELLSKGLLFLLALGAGVVARSRGRDALYYAVVAIGLVGIVLCIILLVLLHDRDVAHAIFDHSTIPTIITSKAYFDGLPRVFVPLGLWLIGTVSTQLGLSDANEQEQPAPTPTPTPAPTS
ncbi:MAG: hypothetical protein V4460_15005 [Pseudomonadota bacterium]|mgnify:CR=1 FL=1|jgi:hypothetical protein